MLDVGAPPSCTLTCLLSENNPARISSSKHIPEICDGNHSLRLRAHNAVYTRRRVLVYRLQVASAHVASAHARTVDMQTTRPGPATRAEKKIGRQANTPEDGVLHRDRLASLCRVT
jgi:hypothetical protein